MKPTFEKFWRRLLKHSHKGGILIENLGKKKEQKKFKISVSVTNGVCIPQATNKIHWFTKVQAKQVWKRFHVLQPTNQHLMAGRYVDGKRPHNWNPCPNRSCSPWIAAAIRDFLGL
jgi:hypothetical protein